MQNTIFLNINVFNTFLLIKTILQGVDISQELFLNSFYVLAILEYNINSIM